ncbi:MAG TPA: DUF397 domain-containing protein [Pilimelia sp.]|nr:DUF397 domain-containing protein [Pilimelia sp.]
MAEANASMVWRRASACESRACVEVAFADGKVFLRRSQDPAGAVLAFSLDEWQAFCAGVETGELRG